MVTLIRWFLVAAVALTLVSGCATGGTSVSYRTPGWEPLTIPATLTLPAKRAERVPAVVIVHGSGGVDGRGAYHAAALNAAGIATLEIDMWTPRGLRGGPNSRPRRISDTVPDAYGALLYLTGHPAIDPARIGIMGFSWGGRVSLLTTSTRLTELWTAGRAKFAAHVPFYPVCSRYQSEVERMTGAPVLILAGAKDDYEEPDSCLKLVDSLTPEQRAHVSLKVYPNGYHGWDASRAATFYDPGAKSGLGGNIRFFPDSRIAEQSRKDAVEFFYKAFGM